MGAAPLVIVGGGVAAARAAQGLVEAGARQDIVVVTAEPHLPYERPALSKTYLRGETTREGLFPLTEPWYHDHVAEIRRGNAVVGLDPGAHELTLADGTTLRYGKVLLATGSTPRPLDVPGADLKGVHLLRTAESADLLAASLRTSLRHGRGRLAVVGDGWVGMEVAASACRMGMRVTVLGHGAQPLHRCLGTELGEFYATVHTGHGVELRRRTVVLGFTGDRGRVSGVLLGDGTVLPADVVVVGIGAVPNTGLAAAAGIPLRSPALGGGIAVDGTLATAAPDVYAAGDVASVPSPRYGLPLRGEHWATARHTGAHAARAMLGSTAAYRKLPYFYSDQFDIGMEFAGRRERGDEVVVSGSVPARSFVAFWVREGRVRAGMAVNTRDRIGEVVSLIEHAGPVPRAALRAFAA
ncbi:NADPH-dependent 2,4-dienoyl-CoA reductase/sulfur reductase-like enzyme [Crossiella equi]|uniref:NADPH-dependent 2,4-dienoyl-CoA reductase/sulfur reductase-like enzyme n=1 Tax=Crossiella equi TaxID=130796 RepID=A0ABS5A984_9PSEU|nr:FAD-dependent oxidoreductase [Crossiella equi]MBP2473133.1 NADPH-dependent 2,4-dienoyl-CoA reductase/sulfur reductase-like enzyme [Crossiella equi]